MALIATVVYSFGKCFERNIDEYTYLVVNVPYCGFDRCIYAMGVLRSSVSAMAFALVRRFSMQLQLLHIINGHAPCYDFDCCVYPIVTT